MSISEDVRRHMAIEAYFEAYEEYKQLDNVQHHIYADVYGNAMIEIHRYYGERKGELVVRVKREDEDMDEVSAEVSAYEWMANCLKDMIRRKREALEHAESDKRYSAGKAVS